MPTRYQGRLSSAKLFIVTIGMPAANVVLSPMVTLLGIRQLFMLLGASITSAALLLLLVGDRDTMHSALGDADEVVDDRGTLRALAKNGGNVRVVPDLASVSRRFSTDTSKI